ncbi:MAG TPA: hypothetical protein DCS73_00630 [Roseburia sp.]|nr:hypothetical protein [Roseburia sp.]
MIIQKYGNRWERRYIYTYPKMRKSIDKKRLACIIKKVLFVGNKQLYILKCNGQGGLLALFLLIQKYFSTITCYNNNVIKTPWRFYI